MPDELAALPRTIQQLLDQRALHSSAVKKIDGTLARINAAIAGGSAVKPSAAKAASPPTVDSSPKPSVKKRAAVVGKTGNEFLLDFIKENKKPTSQQINAAWKASGRNRTADINLSLLTKAKKLKRTPLGPGIRGSTYSIAG